MHQRSLEGKSVGEVIKEDAKELAETGKGVVKKSEGAVEKAVN